MRLILLIVAIAPLLAAALPQTIVPGENCWCGDVVGNPNGAETLFVDFFDLEKGYCHNPVKQEVHNDRRGKDFYCAGDPNKKLCCDKCGACDFANRFAVASCKLTRPRLGLNNCQAGTGASSENTLRSPMGQRSLERSPTVLVARGPDFGGNRAHVLRKWKPCHRRSRRGRESSSRTCRVERVARSIDRTKSWSTPPIVRPCTWRYNAIAGVHARVREPRM